MNTKNTTKSALLNLLAEKDQEIASLQMQVARLEQEVNDLKHYMQGCSEMIGGEGLLAVKIERLIKSGQTCTSCTYQPPEVAKCAKCGKPNPNAKIQAQTKTEKIGVPKEKVIPAFIWLLKKINFEGQVSENFMVKFNIVTNSNRNWWAIKPIKNDKETVAFVKDFIAQAKGKGMVSSYYQNEGAYILLK